MEMEDEEGCDISNLTDLSQAAGCSNVKCESCSGAGSCPCRFCNGTGLFTVGDEVFYGVEGGGVIGSSMGRGKMAGLGNAAKCKICNEGYEECIQCKGAGWMAGWRV